MSDLAMMDVTRYVDLAQAHELAVRQNELYHAMQIVEQCGASAELTEAVNRLGERMRQTQADLVSVCKAATAAGVTPCPTCGGSGVDERAFDVCPRCGGTGEQKGGTAG